MNVKGAAVAAASVCLFLLLAACSGGPEVPSEPGTPTASASTPDARASTPAAPTPSPSRAPSPSFVAAKVGQCRDYSYRQMLAFSQDSKAVSCKKDHTAQTISVTTLPDSALAELGAYWAAGSKAPKVAGKGAVADAAACRATLDKTLGWRKSMIPTAFSVAYFGPSQRSWSEGDRALRCDAVREAGRVSGSGDWTRRLRDLPTSSVKGYVTKAEPGNWAACRVWTQASGDRAYGTCSDEDDVYVTIGQKSLGKAKAAWPGEKAVGDTARTWCWSLVSAFDDGDGFDAHANIPLADGWDRGERSAACFLSWQDWNREAAA